jgi:flagellar M-ring protein FliF
MFESIKSQWASSSGISRVLFFLFLIGLLLGFVYSALWIFKEDYQVLFADLNPQDASGMISELDRNKTPYKLAENGTSILVESDSVYKTRLKLVGKGLNLNGSVGFELFNNSEFGMTEFAQKVNYLRALQGELERTIMGFDEIKAARVHLVLPESGLFKRKNTLPKASVTVAISQNARLSSDQVLGIQKLISASVPEITAAEVTVVDQRGVALTKNVSAKDGEVAVTERLDVKKQLELYLTQKLVGVLDRAIGQGKAIVSVDISLNYDQIKVTKEDIIPLPHTSGQSVGAISRKRTTHQVDESELGQLQTFNEDQLPSNRLTPSSASMSEFEYVNNKRVEQILSSPGAINKLTVGVIVPNLNDPVKLAKLKDVLLMTSGINSSRGDGLVIHDIDIPTLFDGVTTKVDNSAMLDVIENKNIIDKNDDKKFNMSFWHYLLFACFLALALIYFFMGKNEPNKTPISFEDKAKLLEEINLWATTKRSVK